VPIVKPWDLGLDPAQQKSDWTTDTAIQIGKLVNISPAKIDHVIFGYGAGFARGVVEHGTDPLLRLTGLAPKTTDPATSWQRVPVAGTFYREGTVNGSAQSLKDFYAAYEAVVNLKASVTRYAQTGDEAGADARVRREAGERWFSRRAEILAGKAALEEIGHEINAIYAAPLSAMTPEVKRKALDATYEAMVQIARDALGKPPLRAKGQIPVTPRAAGAGTR
jgi:hypothetical protein